jgi:phospholipid/cholesterol/gamma-HCH transport system permease protein
MKPGPQATLTVRAGDAAERLAFAGRLDAAGAGGVWRPALSAAARARGRRLVFDLAGIAAFDMTGAALLVAVEAAHDGAADVQGADPRALSLIALARDARAAAGTAPAAAPSRARFTWHDLLLGFRAAGDGAVFLGQVAIAVIGLPRRWRMLRGAELLRHADQAGVRALPLVLGLGFLMGLILAFQSAVPMRQFGAVLYAANLVSVSLLRELGPLLAAVILAGRTASAFAAEIGTMKVNQEIDALVSMGLDPVTMLVLPRMAAALLVMPFLTLALEIAGLVGMAVVMQTFGFSLSIVEAQVQYWTTTGDLVGGLVKAAVFGAVIGAIGCRAGLSTGVGPRAVGLSATAAVVGGLVSTIVLDGVFAVFFNRLGF